MGPRRQAVTRQGRLVVLRAFDLKGHAMNDMLVKPKTEYHEKMRKDMDKFLRSSDWTSAQRVALSCRILDADGHESALAGQITLRGEKPGTYWGLSFGLGFDEARASNILLFDNDLNVL